MLVHITSSSSALDPVRISTFWTSDRIFFPFLCPGIWRQISTGNTHDAPDPLHRVHPVIARVISGPKNEDDDERTSGEERATALGDDPWASTRDTYTRCSTAPNLITSEEAPARGHCKMENL